MDLKKINKDQMNVILIFAMLAGAIIVGVLVLLPMTRSAHDLGSRTRLMDEEIALVNNFIKSNDHSLVRGKLITVNEASLALEEITALGNKHEIVFLSMVRQDNVKSTRKKTKVDNALSIELETRSTYQQLGLFLGGLNDLSQSIVLVDNFQITRDKPDLSKVKTKIHIKICLKN